MCVYLQLLGFQSSRGRSRTELDGIAACQNQSEAGRMRWNLPLAMVQRRDEGLVTQEYYMPRTVDKVINSRWVCIPAALCHCPLSEWSPPSPDP